MSEDQAEYITEQEVSEAMEMLGKGYGNRKLNGGFKEPTWTQVPNDLFDMIDDMTNSELRVTLVMVRQTKGFHRNAFKMGINELASKAGLSRNGAKSGAEAAENRGTFRRTNPLSQKEAEWELIVQGGQPVTNPSQPVTINRSTSDRQVGVKERIKKPINKKEGGEPAQPKPPKASDFPELVLFREVVRHWPKPVQWESVIESVKKINLRLLRPATVDDLAPFWKAWGVVSGNEWSLVWLVEWAVSGKIPQKPNGNGVNKTQAAIQQFLNMQQPSEVIDVYAE